MDCQYTSRQKFEVLYGLPVHQQGLVEFYMDYEYTSREKWSSIWTASTPEELYKDCQYTSREQWSSIWTASTPVESNGALY